MTDYGPSINVCKLYERTSAKGNVYLTGKLGGLSICIMKAEKLDDGTQTWTLKFSEAPQRQGGYHQPRQFSASDSAQEPF